MASIKETLEAVAAEEQKNLNEALVKSVKAQAARDEALEKLEPVINPEFQDLLDVQTQVSYDELKKSIEAEGVRDPITVWQEQNTLVDGHNRLKIAKELGIPCPTTERSFADETEVKTWIIRNQLGRRNLTPARFEYYIGKLYNEQKATTFEEKQAKAEKGEGSTAEKIAKEFEVSEKTVRRYGDQARGIDQIEKVRGKLAKERQLSNKPEYTAEEVAIIGAAPNAAVAKRTISNMDEYKSVAKAKKVENKQVKATIQQQQIYYHVALCEPEFGVSGFSTTTEPKPSLDKNSAVYMIVPDEYLVKGVELFNRWQLTYEGTFVYWSTKTYDNVFSKVAHQFVLMGTKGTITGPKVSDISNSCNVLNGDIGPVVVKLIEKYHNGTTKKLDMRRGKKAAPGWDSIK